MSETSKRSRVATLALWGLSIVSAAGLLWLVSGRLELWPDDFALADPQFLYLAAAIYVPYMVVRAYRLVFILDPMVAGAAGGRADRRVVFGSGFLSFFMVLLVPFRLGELSRPLLLGRAQQPGIDVPAALGAVAIERIVDGLLICAMLFAGLAVSPVALAVDVSVVHQGAQIATAVFAACVLLLVVGTVRPVQAASVTGRVSAVFGPWVQSRAVAVTRSVTGAMRDLVRSGRGVAFVITSLVYWALTVAHFWALAVGAGLELDAGQCVVLVAVVGLAIQLPGGPGQTGSFQVGAAMGLSLFVDLAHHPGAAVFAAAAFVFQFVGTAVATLPGLGLLALARRRP